MKSKKEVKVVKKEEVKVLVVPSPVKEETYYFSEYKVWAKNVEEAQKKGKRKADNK